MENKIERVIIGSHVLPVTAEILVDSSPLREALGKVYADLADELIARLSADIPTLVLDPEAPSPTPVVRPPAKAV